MIMLILLVSSPILAFVVHMLVSRLSRRFSPQMGAIVSILIAQILMALLLYYFVFHGCPTKTAELVSAFLYCFIVYNALTYTYFHLFNMTETSRRIRTAYELEKAGHLHVSDIVPVYGTTDLIDGYLEKVVALNQLTCKNGRYVLSGRLFYYAALVLKALSYILGFQLYSTLSKLSKTPEV